MFRETVWTHFPLENSEANPLDETAMQNVLETHETAVKGSVFPVVGLSTVFQLEAEDPEDEQDDSGTDKLAIKNPKRSVRRKFIVFQSGELETAHSIKVARRA